MTETEEDTQTAEYIEPEESYESEEYIETEEETERQTIQTPNDEVVPDGGLNFGEIITGEYRPRPQK